MKTVISILSALLVLLSLTACAGKAAKPAYDATKPTYVGTWELDHVVIGGSTFTPSELKAVGQDIQSGLVLKDGGKAFMTWGSDQGVLDWSETENGIQIDNLIFTMEDGFLRVGSEDAILYFKKVSESQLFESQADKETQEAKTESLETIAPTSEATTAPTTETTTAPTTEATTEPATEAATDLIDGMRPEFKEAMDAYESFYKEYCELLRKYTQNPTDFSILGQYTNMLTKIDEVDKAFKKWDQSDLNSEELKYYLDVNNRVLKMMVDIAG